MTECSVSYRAESVQLVKIQTHFSPADVCRHTGAGTCIIPWRSDLLARCTPPAAPSGERHTRKSCLFLEKRESSQKYPVTLKSSSLSSPLSLPWYSTGLWFKLAEIHPDEVTLSITLKSSPAPGTVLCSSPPCQRENKKIKSSEINTSLKKSCPVCILSFVWSRGVLLSCVAGATVCKAVCYESPGIWVNRFRSNSA